MSKWKITQKPFAATQPFIGASSKEGSMPISGRYLREIIVCDDGAGADHRGGALAR
jgi:hypothetical protein